MRFTMRGYGMLLVATGVALLSGCGSKGTTPSSSNTLLHPPVTTAATWNPGDAQPKEFTSYVFTTIATDPDIGVGITSYDWDFGDGTPAATFTTLNPSTPYTYTTAGTFNLKVRATNSGQVVGAYSSESVTIAPVTNPYTITAVSPTTAASLQVGLGSSTGVVETFSIQVVDADGSVSASGISLNPGDVNVPAATVGPVTGGNGGLWSIPVTYQAAPVAGIRTANPTVTVTDNLGISSAITLLPSITLTTAAGLAANHPPVITVLAPTAATTAAFTSSTQTLTFALADADGDPLTYSVDWGDGTAAVPGTLSSNTLAGANVTLTHAFPDTFTGPATVTVSCTDNRVASPVTASLHYNVTFNTYPTAVITSPQASATTPAAVTAWEATLPLAVAQEPAVVILPINGTVSFAGTATLPGSQEGALTYLWDFNGGSPATVGAAAMQNPGDVTFGGTAGQITVYTVKFTVTDMFTRISSADPTKASPAATSQAFQQTYERLVVVDGLDSQLFTISFLYRQRSGTSAADSYSLATTAGHGLNAGVHIFQDGINNTYTVASAGTATTQIPVRSDVPFWLSIPAIAGDTTDVSSYMVSIPNLPGQDPDLQVGNLAISTPMTLTPGLGTGFAFASLTAPWNPQLQITTGSGFGLEGVTASQRKFQGSSNLFNDYCNFSSSYDANYRWMDRLAIPLALPLLDLLPVDTEWNQGGNDIHSFSGIAGYQSIPEWFIIEKATATRDWNGAASPAVLGGFTTASVPTDLGFVVSDSYNALGTSSTHLAVTGIQIYRAPSSTSDPYDFDVMKATCNGTTFLTDDNGGTGLNPTPLANSPLAFLSGLVNNPPGGVPLAGGLSQVTVPYNANDVNRIPNTTIHNTPFTDFVNFSYAEYLWTKVWARPLVVNRTNLSYFDTHSHFVNMPYAFPGVIGSLPSDATAADECGTGTEVLTEIPNFFYSNPTANTWPNVDNVSPDGSSYNMNVVNGGHNANPAAPVYFDASSPVSSATVDPPPATNGTGVGRFFWTAFAPHFNANGGGLISRTWLADGTTNKNQIPVTFNADASDATTAWGFVPPQDVQVDKRARTAGLVSSPATLGGYRIIWYNPTVNTQTTSSPVVAPDFWAVQVVNPSNTANPNQVFLLSANYPRNGQSLTNSLMTDAQVFLPSGQSSYQTGDLDGTGYCWFDVPPELQPASGASVTITVFALKSILKNNPVSIARVINRSEWIEAVKTVTANISTLPGGNDVSFAHKIPFNYPWDIVVVNSPATPVSGN